MRNAYQGGRRDAGPIAVLVFAIGGMLACGSSSGPSAPSSQPVESCGPFGDWRTSSFVLPYQAGASFFLNQANCSGFGHSGFWKHGYDFTMVIGTEVRAARAGTVLHSQGGAVDGDRQRTNLVTIQHDDGSVALYSHLTLNGNLVPVGARVEAGWLIGLSGDTGNTGGLPHLHFSLHPCGDLPGLPGIGTCAGIPVNFRNTDPNPNGLAAGQFYVALPFDSASGG